MPFVSYWLPIVGIMLGLIVVIKIIANQSE